MKPDSLVGLHIDDLAFDALDAVALAELAQELGVQAGVDVERVVHAAARQMREAVLLGRFELQAIVAVVAGQVALAALQPEMLEAGGPVVLAGDAEGMNVVLFQVAPVLEADAELERALGRGHEFLLVDVEQAMKGDQRRNGRLADADGADLVGLDQLDVQDLARASSTSRRPPSSRRCRRRR